MKFKHENKGLWSIRIASSLRRKMIWSKDMTTYVVIDAGLAFTLVAPNPRRIVVRELVREWTIAQRTLCAPSLWLYEVTSIFSKSVRFGELNETEAQKGLNMALSLGVQLISPDDTQARNAYIWTRRLQRAAAYDSFYLALAEDLKCELWTMDKKLANAVNQPWIRLVRQNDFEE